MKRSPDYVRASDAFDRTARYFLSNGHSPSIPACVRNARDVSNPVTAVLVSFSAEDFSRAISDACSACEEWSAPGAFGDGILITREDVLIGMYWRVATGYVLVHGESEGSWERAHRLANVVVY